MALASLDVRWLPRGALPPAAGHALAAAGLSPGACMRAARELGSSCCWFWAFWDLRFGVDREPCRSCVHSLLMSPAGKRAVEDPRYRGGAGQGDHVRLIVRLRFCSRVHSVARCVVACVSRTFFTPTRLAREPPGALPVAGFAPGALWRRLSLLPKILAARASFFLRSRPVDIGTC